MTSSISDRSSTRTELAGRVQAVAAGYVVERIGQAAAFGSQSRRKLGDQDRRRDSVLVPDGIRIDAVAQRLLVAEPQTFDPADPLEPGKRLRVAEPARPRSCPAATTRSSRRRPRSDRAPEPIKWVASRAPTSSPVSIATGRRRSADGTSVGVGVVGDDQIRLFALRERHCQVDGPGLLGVGERHRREIRIGRSLLADGFRSREAGGLHGPAHRRRSRAAVCGRFGGRAVRPAGRPTLRVGRRHPRPCRRASPIRTRLGMDSTVPTASISAEISTSAGATIWEPSPRNTLYRCPAVDCARPSPRRRRRLPSAGWRRPEPGRQRPRRTIARIPAPTITAQVSRANWSDLWRASKPTTTLDPPCARR